MRGTEDGFTAATFHKKCDEQGPTVTVVQVKETMQIIGGYTSLSWNSPKGNYYFEADPLAFIFSLTRNGLYLAKENQK